MRSEGTESLGWLSHCQQLFDTALPNGGYAHSQGLEGLIQLGEITDEAGFRRFLTGEFADNFIHTELPFFCAAHRAVASNDLARLTEIDQHSWATRGTRELREASRTVGRQTLLLFGRILNSDTREARTLARAGEFLEHHQSNVVLGALAAILHIPRLAAGGAFGQQLLASLITTTIKLLHFGPAQTQRLLFEHAALIPEWVRTGSQIPVEEAGTLAPRWEIASARHEHAHQRLFIS